MPEFHLDEINDKSTFSKQHSMIVQVKHSGWVHLKTGQCMYSVHYSEIFISSDYVLVWQKCFLFVPFLWLCTCAIVNFLFITFQCRQPGWRLHSGRLHFEATITVWEICASSQNFKRQLGTSTNAKVAFLYLCISYFSFLSHQFPMPRAAQPQKEVDFVFSC